MKKLFTITLFLCFYLSVHAQDFKYGDIEGAEYNFDKKTLDSNANAVVLREYGTARMLVNEGSGELELIFEHHIRIKIFNDQAFDKANIVIPLHKSADGRFEILSAIQATTYNQQGGKFEPTELDSKKVFNENKSKYTTLAKFTFPNIKAGSVIEYKYVISSPFYFNFRTWDFQDDIPKVYSEFVAFIPPVFNYNIALRGAYQLTKNVGVVEKDCVVLQGQHMDCSKMTYGMSNIPAFTEEEYMTAASNFRSAIYFELSDIQNVSGSKQNFTKNWTDVDYELKTDKTFGSQMKRKEVFKDKIGAILANTTDGLSKAKAVYNYIRKEIKWDNYRGAYSEDGIKKALETHSGNVGDINLSLIAALSAADLDVEAVVLSVRDNGIPNKLFPVLSDFDYVVAKVNIGDKSYLLDATEPLLPFGLLPLRCINDQGRVISLKKPSYWLNLKAEQKSTTTYMLDGTLNDAGKIAGKMIVYYQGYAAFDKRKEIKAANSIEEYVEKLDERMPKVAILKHSIANLDSTDLTLTEEFDIEFDVLDGNQGDKFYINPFLVNKYTKNPFKLNARSYPVDMGTESNEQSIIHIKLNKPFTIVEKPKDVSLGLPNGGGRFIVKTDLTDNILSINQSIQFNKATYGAEEYVALKEFFSQIIQTHKTDFLLEKAK